MAWLISVSLRAKPVAERPAMMNTPNPQTQPQGQGFANRRTFVRVAAGGIGLCYAAAMGYPVYRYLASPMEKAEGGRHEVTLKDARRLPSAGP